MYSPQLYNVSVIKSITFKHSIIFFSIVIAFVFLQILFLWKDIPFGYLLPVALFAMWAVFTDLRVLPLSLLFFLPLSLEFSFGSLSLSTPTEPIMIALTAVLIILSFSGRFGWKKIQNHPLVILIALQFIWFVVNIFISREPVLSTKYLLAKIWFMGACVFMTSYFFRSEKFYKVAIWLLMTTTLVTILYTLGRHALVGFSFEESSMVCKPFYLNHVNYSSFIALSLPFAVAAIFWFKGNKFAQLLMVAAVVIIIIGIILSYTRTTWLSLIIALVSLIVFRWKILRLSIIIGWVVVASAALYLVDENRYIAFAPDYKHTIFNREDFGKHMQATVELSDVSGMERVYRWVAAQNLIKDNFWFGTGNNTFYPTYKQYANPAFVTYVSDNPERSTTHNYFLLLFCDQGLPGMLLFIVFYMWAMIRCNELYFRSQSKFRKNLMLSCFATLVILLVHLMLGDMIEIDKTGAMFYLIIGIIIATDIAEQNNQSSSNSLKPLENTLNE